MVKWLMAALVSVMPVTVFANDYAAKTFNKTIPSGKKFKLEAFHSVNPDCTSRGYPEVRLQAGPSHGKISLGRGTGYPNFNQNVASAKCNTKPVAATIVWYTPEKGFVGGDSVELYTIYPTGNTQVMTYNIAVK
jgi:hypothetical protein